MKILTDTDILSYYLKGYPEVVEKLDNHETTFQQVFISRISIVEILGGLKAKNASKQEARFRQFLSTRSVLEIDALVGEKASEIFAELYKSGKHSGNYDILIAATAIVHGCQLCTNNIKDYRHIKGLELVNWKG